MDFTEHTAATIQESTAVIIVAIKFLHGGKTHEYT